LKKWVAKGVPSYLLLSRPPLKRANPSIPAFVSNILQMQIIKVRNLGDIPLNILQQQKSPAFVSNNLQMQTIKVRNLGDMLLNILQPQQPIV
jgi:hypothetical protein